MHFDTRLIYVYIILINTFIVCFCQYSDEQSYLSLIEFNRGGPLTSVILSSPHGGYLGANATQKSNDKSSNNVYSAANLLQLPIGGCYNNTLDRCVYTLRDCLKSEHRYSDTISFYPDARCVIDRSSTSAMYSLTKAIAEAFTSQYRPFTILNKLTRQYVDPAEDLLAGTFLLESATRIYMDYHRFIAMAKEAIRGPGRGLFIEFVFHRSSEIIQLGYGYEINRLSNSKTSFQSTITELILRTSPNIIYGNRSLGHFLHRNGFKHIIPYEHPTRFEYRLSTHSTRIHADQRFNAILFSYPIERLRTHAIKTEAIRIAKAIEQFMHTNDIKLLSSASLMSINLISMLLLLFLSIFRSLIHICH